MEYLCGLTFVAIGVVIFIALVRSGKSRGESKTTRPPTLEQQKRYFKWAGLNQGHVVPPANRKPGDYSGLFKF